MIHTNNSYYSFDICPDCKSSGCIVSTDSFGGASFCRCTTCNGVGLIKIKVIEKEQTSHA